MSAVWSSNTDHWSVPEVAAPPPREPQATRPSASPEASASARTECLNRACSAARADELPARTGSVVGTEAIVPRFGAVDAEINQRVRLDPVAVLLAISLELNVS